VKNLSLAVLIIALAAGVVATQANSAIAAPRLGRFMVADQLNSPTTPNRSDSGNTAASNASPSKKLSESNGVIRPPPTGDHSVVMPPPTETTNKAVIAPPGTPGGDQTVQPK